MEQNEKRRKREAEKAERRERLRKEKGKGRASSGTEAEAQDEEEEEEQERKEILELWELRKAIYGYDAAEAAEEWYAQWGILQEIATSHRMPEEGEDVGNLVSSVVVTEI